MEQFKISDIQEIFVSDVERFHTLTQQHVTRLLNGTPPPQESLDEALRQCHTLKGLAGTVQAWGLACLGADLEKLLELAGSWMQNDREKADGVFEFILDHMQDWYVMNQFSCMEMLPQAWDIYQGLRGIMDERWPAHLPVHESAAVAGSHFVRLADLELPELPATEETEPATLVDLPTPELDVQDAQPIASTAPPAAPTPLRVVPPQLIPKNGPVRPSLDENIDVQQSELITRTEPPTAPKPLHVVPPTLRRRKDAEVAPTVSPEAVVPPTATAAHAVDAATEVSAPTSPRILRVAPPALKRLETKPQDQESPKVEAAGTTAPMSVEPMAIVPATVEPSAVQPSSVEPSAIVPEPVELGVIEPLAAEDIFAALAVPTEPPTVEPATISAEEAEAVPEFTPTADADLVELLGQEVAAHLAELTANLTALAANLTQEKEWERTRRIFHTIKGTAATFNLEAISTPAREAEARCLEALENGHARNRETFETCVHRANMVAQALHLPFDEQSLREALELGSAQSADSTATPATSETAPLDPEMAGFFINDTHDQIQIIEQAVLCWEKNDQPPEQVRAAQRGFHTIKGAANSIGLTAVAQSVHEVEAYLEIVADAEAVGSRPLFTFLLGAVDQLRHYLTELARNTATPWRNDWSSALCLLGQPGATAASATPTSAPVVQASMSVDSLDENSHTLRIEADRLYQVMNLIGEMVIDRARLARKIEQLTTLHRSLTDRNGALIHSVQSFQEQFEFNLLQSEGQGRRTESGRNREDRPATSHLASPVGSHEFSELEFDRYDQFNILARSLVEVSHDIEQLNKEVAECLDSFAAENVQFTQTSQQLQSKVTNLSLVPINTLFPRLQRAFRDALNVEGKEADLTLLGGDALLDKVVVDKVYAPLLHLLRNAVAHGIETTDTRENLKKPSRGQVRLSATQLSNQIVIQIADDGAGVDADAVRKRAVDKGWLAADAPALTPEQVVHYIFQPGFSTATKVTSVSGRGIGLDVVRQEIENLNGSVELKYKAQQGSTWTLCLPLTLSISEAILAKVGETTFAFPLNFIESGLILDAPTTHSENGREIFTRELLGAMNPEPNAPDNEPPAPSTECLPVLRLSKLFHLPGDENANKGLIVSVGERRTIVVVDLVLTRQEIVIKQLDSVMTLHPLLNGATLDPEGRVIPILNLPTLLKFGENHTEAANQKSEARSQKADLAPGAAESKRVLIVDDSLSVRKVQERFLTDLGCKVTTASDGLMALEKLREQDFDLIFTDLEMPRLNGYELITELHGNPAWASIPVVVISSRGADKYITKAMSLGATTFLAKPFTQQQLQQVLQHYSKATGVAA
jgi:chemosensory pili system protein ChpA (sensor histidine kinase/response regulator)